MSVQTQRADLVRIGVRIEVFTVLWMIVGAVVSIGAGALARSALLTAFGIDSVVELGSGAILHFLDERIPKRCPFLTVLTQRAGIPTPF